MNKHHVTALAIAFSLLLSIPLISEAASFTRNLSWGMSGADVSQLQTLLTSERVYAGPITGGFYGLTLQAVKDFQSKYNITPLSGFFGPLTRAQAEHSLANTSGTVLGTNASATQSLMERIRVLQNQIAALKSKGASGSSSSSSRSSSSSSSGGSGTSSGSSTATAAVPSSSGTTGSTTTVPPTTSGLAVHKNITAAVFWVGESKGGGSSEDNSMSAWDDEWEKNFGGFDDPENRNGYYPVGFTPKQNPFYLDVPYNDFNDNGNRKSNAAQVVPWASEKTWSSRESMMKNRWVKLTRGTETCYGQIEDAGPYQYDDSAYVFGSGTIKPKSTTANNAGLDVSPAIRDCLKFNGVNNVDNKVDWQFVSAADVPSGPWKQIITTTQINWP